MADKSPKKKTTSTAKAKTDKKGVNAKTDAKAGNKR
jgi:hypothetical protein